MKAPKPESTFTLIPEDQYLARLVQLIDLGTHEEEFQGKPKIQRKLRLAFETPEAQHEWDENIGPEPFIVGRQFTFSMGAKANLRQFIEAWFGKKFPNDEEAYNFDMERLLAQTAIITVGHRVTANNKTVAEITSISRPFKGMTVPPQITPTLFYSIEEGNNEVFKAIPKWLQEIIVGSREWKEQYGAHNGAPINDSQYDGLIKKQPPAPRPAPQPAQTTFAPQVANNAADDDEMPF